MILINVLKRQKLSQHWKNSIMAQAFSFIKYKDDDATMAFTGVTV
ncbi:MULTISPECIES: hypothetical protein [Bartonella]|nr:hypothetical protein [Bartonella grahamii]